nr:putative NAD(P)H dehydrogenase (quinone) FQR1-like 1 [Tanacetum cinerariifolium]
MNHPTRNNIKGEDGGGFIAAEPRQWWLAAAVVMAVGSVVLVVDMVATAWCRQWGRKAAGGVGVEVEMAAEYYSMYEIVRKLAHEIKKGAAFVEGVEAKLWQVDWCQERR